MTIGRKEKESKSYIKKEVNLAIYCDSFESRNVLPILSKCSKR